LAEETSRKRISLEISNNNRASKEIDPKERSYQKLSNILFKKSKPSTFTTPKSSQQVSHSFDKLSDEIEHASSNRLLSTVNVAESNRKLNGETGNTDASKKRIVFLFKDKKQIHQIDELNRKYDNKESKQLTTSKMGIERLKVSTIVTQNDEGTTAKTQSNYNTLVSGEDAISIALTSFNSPTRLATPSPKKSKRCVHSIQELTSKASKMLTPLKVLTLGSTTHQSTFNEKSNQKCDQESMFTQSQKDQQQKEQNDAETSPNIVNTVDEDFLDISISDNLSTLI
jgi:hypothetical protein